MAYFSLAFVYAIVMSSGGWADSSRVTAQLGAKDVTYHILRTDLQKAPQWKESQLEPPLPPRKAIEVGFEALESFTKKGLLTYREPGLAWKVRKISLVNIHEKYWYYEVLFKEAVEPGFAASGKRETATVIVLFDQSVVSPEISP
jgi:hypothetical protein